MWLIHLYRLGQESVWLHTQASWRVFVCGWIKLLLNYDRSWGLYAYISIGCVATCKSSTGFPRCCKMLKRRAKQMDLKLISTRTCEWHFKCLMVSKCLAPLDICLRCNGLPYITFKLSVEGFFANMCYEYRLRTSKPYLSAHFWLMWRWSISNRMQVYVVFVPIHSWCLFSELFFVCRTGELNLDDLQQKQPNDNSWAGKKWAGRPNWRRIFSEIATSHPKTNVGVFLCGPGAKDIQAQCKQSSKSGETTFDFHKENF